MQSAKTLIRLGGCPADLSLRWAHTHFVDFVMSRLTCLVSVKPHLTAEEYRHTESVVQQFAANEGKLLHEKLLQKAATSRNWVSKMLSTFVWFKIE